MNNFNSVINNGSEINIVTIAPDNYEYTGTWDEISDNLFYSFKELGFKTQQSKNFIQKNAKNIVLGAALLHPSHAQSLPKDTIIYNFEQLSHESPFFKITPQYKETLKMFQVWDYSKRNIEFLKTLKIKFSPLHVPLGFVDKMERIEKSDQEDIDVLFYGCLNDRRKKILNDLESSGLQVKVLEKTFGSERDSYIARSKIILNMHYYETNIFEMARAFYLLANKKVIVSEIAQNTEIPEYVKFIVSFTEYGNLVNKCLEITRNKKMKDSLENLGYNSFKNFKQVDFLKNVIVDKELIFKEVETNNNKIPLKLNIGSGKDFKDDCVNLDIQGYWSPDVIADLSDKKLLNTEFQTDRFGKICFKPGIFDQIICNDVIEHIPDVVSAMTNCLHLLAENGTFDISVPYDLSYGAWQDPTHVRAFNERSWLYYTDWHWYLGWTEARFKLVKLNFIPSEIGIELLKQGCEKKVVQRTPRAIDTMTVSLQKILLTNEEKERAQKIASR